MLNTFRTFASSDSDVAVEDTVNDESTKSKKSKEKKKKGDDVDDLADDLKDLKVDKSKGSKKDKKKKRGGDSDEDVPVPKGKTESASDSEVEVSKSKQKNIHMVHHITNSKRKKNTVHGQIQIKKQSYFLMIIRLETVLVRTLIIKLQNLNVKLTRKM